MNYVYSKSEVEMHQNRLNPKKYKKYSELRLPSFLFTNPVYKHHQAQAYTRQKIREWKQTHHNEVIEYQNKYNKTHDIYRMSHKHCNYCNKDVSNYFSHCKSNKHIDNVQKHPEIKQTKTSKVKTYCNECQRNYVNLKLHLTSKKHRMMTLKNKEKLV